MKWKHKGHEFDEVYARLRTKKRWQLFGAGRDGKLVLGILKTLFGDRIEVAGWWDNDPVKDGTTYEGLPVTVPQEKTAENADTGIILTLALAGSRTLETQLTALGWERHVDFCHYYTFLGVFAAYGEGKLFFPSVGFLPTTYCNLNCNACLNFTPYRKRFYHRPLDEVKRDIDRFFSVVDFIGLFHVTGGEPLLYPGLAELLRYLVENYGDRIASLQTVTNGTILPPEAVLDVFRTHDITITVDDYRGALPQPLEKYEVVYDAFVSAAGKERVRAGRYDHWLDLAPERAHPPKTEAELCAHFDACRIPWSSYHDGRLYLCNYADFAADAGIGPAMGEAESIDFATYEKPRDLKSFMEFRLGYSARGYTGFCLSLIHI